MYIPTARDLREIATSQYDKNPHTLMKQIVTDVIHEAGRGNTSCNFYTNGEHLSDRELKMLRDAGWIIRWNRPCLWYEIDWD